MSTRVEDKRLDEVITIRKPKGFTMVENAFIGYPELSWKAKGIMEYLKSKPDGWKVVVRDIVNHATDEKAAVYSGLKELAIKGFYKKVPIRTNDGRRISHWESTITLEPLEPLETLANPDVSLLSDFQEIEKQEIENQVIENQVIENRERSNKELSNKDFRKKDFNKTDIKSESASTPTADVKNVYGDYQNVKLTQSEYDSLLQSIGEKKTKHYIKRIGATMANKGTRYASHYRTILDWCEEDTEKEAENPKQAVQAYSTPKNKNRFINYEQHEYDWDKIKQLEEEYIDNWLDKSKAEKQLEAVNI